MSFSPTIQTTSPVSKVVSGAGFIMEVPLRSMPMTRQAALSRIPDSRMVRPTSGVFASMVNCSRLTSGGRCCSSSCFRFSTRFSTNSRKTLISWSVAATMMWSKGYRRSSPPGILIRSSPRMIVTTLTPQV